MEDITIKIFPVIYLKGSLEYKTPREYKYIPNFRNLSREEIFKYNVGFRDNFEDYKFIYYFVSDDKKVI